MTHALVTGGCGFIGHHFIGHALRATDWRITVLDGLTYAGDVSRIQEVDGYTPDRVRILWHDLRAPLMDSLVSRIGTVDYIVSIASESHVDRSISNPVEFAHNNVMLILHLLEYARQVKPKVVVHLGTDEEFGPAPDGYCFREWDTHLPSNPYAASKSAQSSFATAWWRTYGVPLILLKAMNNFGERQNPEKLIPKTIKCALKRTPMPVHAEKVEGRWEAGSRTWLHAENTADAMLYVLQNICPARYGDSDRPDAYNVAGDSEVSNLDMVLHVNEILGTEPLYEMVDFHASRPGHDRRYALDGGKLRGLGWRPPLTFHDSLERTVRWYVDHPEWL